MGDPPCKHAELFDLEKVSFAGGSVDYGVGTRSNPIWCSGGLLDSTLLGKLQVTCR